MSTSDELRDISREVRKKILTMANRSKGAHVGTALSCVDILTTLYFDTMDYPLDRQSDRDVFILSKGHGAMALYATLAAKNVIPARLLDGYLLDGGSLPGHLDRTVCAGVEVSTGALGHGFNIAIGMAHALKLDGKANRVFTVIGDGEAQEGSIWEGAMLAPRLALCNLTAIMDRNDLQGYGRPSELLHFEPQKEKWLSFGWDAVDVDGHDHDALRAVLSHRSGRPKMVIAHTVKGKGVSFMEDQLKWHYFIVTDDHLKEALREMDDAK